MRRSRIHRSASNSRAINKKGSNIRAPHRSRRGALTRRAPCYFIGMTRQTFSFAGLMVSVLDEFRAQRRQADLPHASERRVIFYAKPTRADAGQAGRQLGHSTQLGTEGYIRYIKDIYETIRAIARSRSARSPVHEELWVETSTRIKEGISQHEAFALRCRTRIRTLLGGPSMLLLSFNRSRKG
jgi:hypothetical protein